MAAVNGPRLVVVSGDAEALEEFLAGCAERGVEARRIPVDYASHSHHVERLRETLAGLLDGITPRPGRVPLYSAVTGEPDTVTETDGAYWYRNLRMPVRFEAAVRTALAARHDAFIEVSPHPVAAVGLSQTVEDAGADAAVLTTLRRGQGDWARMLTALGEAFVTGVPVDWAAVHAGGGGRRVPLPTYAFQRRSYWLDQNAQGAADVTGAGLDGTGHGLLGAAVPVAGGDRWLLTGRLSLATHPWLADHAVDGTVLLPGTAFAELAVRAADQVGCATVAELTLQAPLALAPDAPVRLQVWVDEADERGRRALTVSSCPERDPGQEWTCHAVGVLAEDAEPADTGDDLVVWPPSGARPVPVDGLYERLGTAGYGYGPAFRGLRAVWQAGDDLYAEAALPDSVRGHTDRFGLHPALLDAALHGMLAGDWFPGEDGEARDEAAVRLVRDAAARLRRGPAAAADPAHRRRGGRPARGGQHGRARRHRGLARPAGRVRRAARGRPGTAAPVHGRLDGAAHRVRAACRGPLGGGAGSGPAARRTGRAGCRGDGVLGGDGHRRRLRLRRRPRARGQRRGGHRRPDARPGAGLARLRRRGRRPAGAGHPRRGARRAGEDADVAQAAVWGLVRTAQAENPGRFTLIDIDGSEGGARALAAALAAEEPQLAVRDGRALVARLRRAVRRELPVPEAPAWRLETGGDGTLDGLALVPHEEALRPLAEGEIRVGIRAAGLNFRDVVVALGLVPGLTGLGGEAAGVVLETGPGVTGFAVGDRVMGLVQQADAYGPVAVADSRTLARIPDGWTFAQAASVPAVFLTAYHALVELAGLKAGETVLIHAATGGVGMAAVQLARHLGAEVYATASRPKWPTLRAMGFDDTHIASSRDLDFEKHILDVTGGKGVDVVLDSLAGEFVDASLRALGDSGGRFVEMGKTDIRDPKKVADRHPGVDYRAFDLQSMEPEHLQAMFGELMRLFEAGGAHPAPADRLGHPPRPPKPSATSARPATPARSSSPSPDPSTPHGTALITGATGTLGRLVARHLVTHHHIRHLLLTGRRGLDADGMPELVTELENHGATVTVEALDITDHHTLTTLLDNLTHPLTLVVHTAGLIDDGILAQQTPRPPPPRLAAQNPRRPPPPPPHHPPRPRPLRPLLLHRRHPRQRRTSQLRRRQRRPRRPRPPPPPPRPARPLPRLGTLGGGERHDRAPRGDRAAAHGPRRCRRARRGGGAGAPGRRSRLRPADARGGQARPEPLPGRGAGAAARPGPRSCAPYRTLRAARRRRRAEDPAGGAAPGGGRACAARPGPRPGGAGAGGGVG
ncbi:hypothetical protein GCM10020256_37030 [Streptomyces thermocoprophilus]